MRYRIRSVSDSPLVQGRYDGANGIPGRHHQSGIDRRMDEFAERLARDAGTAIHRMEAALAYSHERLAEMRLRLARYDGDGRPQSLGYGLILLATFAALLAAEGYLLMPTMRGFGIAHPMHQVIAAGSIVLVGAILLKYVYEDARVYFGLPAQQRRAAPLWTMQRILLPALGIFTLVLFVLLGLFRASEMIFAHGLDPESDLGRFVSEHDVLTRATIVALTVALPVGGAIALSHGIGIVREWARWMRIRFLCMHHHRRTHVVAREIDAVRERLAKDTAAVRLGGEALKAEYEYGQDQGRTLGLYRLPVWFYALKTAAVVALTFFLIYVADQWAQARWGEMDSIRWLFYGLLGAAVGALYGARQWFVRERPSPEDLHWKPHWAEEPVRRRAAVQEVIS
ncbi:MAG: hypothetical protein KF868_22385 [Acidobacteria bacterium]|nr:hypothetical protein [Acidobacteriota bacterium]MCW5971356.1 hypothetical protein [Blastocatellales bacterium]